jgi:hypothetical protein
MSFTNSLTKPKLVDNKIIVRINKVQKILEEQNVSFIHQLTKNLHNFISKNIGSLIVITLLIILLYYRYNEVQEKKKNKKKQYIYN